MSLSAIEDRLMAETKAALTLDGQPKYRQVSALPGELDAPMLKRLIAASPGAYWSFLGGRAEPADGGVELNGNWGLYLLTAHASGHGAQRRGDARQLGAYEMIARLVPRLHQLVLPGHGMLVLKRLQNLFTAGLQSQGVSLYGLSFEMPICFSDDADLSGFASFPDAVNLGRVPEVGIGHEDDYSPLTDGAA